MNIHELEELLTDLESDRVERKASASDSKKIHQAICAFANDLPHHQLPGVVFIGVHDNGDCANLAITDQLLLTLSQMREHVLPFPTIKVQKHILNGCDIAVIIVEPADAPPVRYDGRVWIRVGPRRAVATREEERRLSEKRRAKDVPFDLQPVFSATIEDLDLDIFRRTYLPSTLHPDILDENDRVIEHQLSSTRFVATNEQLTPTILGILVVGKDPRQFIPGAYIQFLRIDGNNLTDPIKDSKEIDGPLPEMLQRLDDIFQAHISIASDVTSQPVEMRQPDYPLVALRQLAYNAILHRTYDATNAPARMTWFSDRIEIYNPGGPYGQVTKQNFGQPGITDYRNAYLAESMKNLGYVQRFGLGIPLTYKSLQDNGNPLPEFTAEDAHIQVIIRRRP
ncbi:MAG: transcriptional regulator [bacterium]|nr:transcriptional regulator [bacterium]